MPADAAPPSLDVCPSCGNRSDADTYCSRCGADLHVDLFLSTWQGDERSRYAAARDLASLKLSGLGFTQLRQALSGPAGTPVGLGLDRSAARQVMAAVARHGGQVTVRPTGDRVAGPAGALTRSRPWLPVLLGGAILLVVVGVLVLSADEPGESAPDPGANPPTAERPAFAETETEPVEPALTTDQIAARVEGAIATVVCKQSLGTAFFVEPDRAVTNAHVACAQGEAVTVKLADDRSLPGIVAIREPRHDMAVIDVPGAGVEPLALGDSTTLSVGQPVVFIGNPQGLTATVHEGKVSFVGRNLHGTAYIQVNGDVNPGNSGGPLLDLQARAVGIISLKARADRIGFALPLAYLEPYLASLNLAPEARARWRDIVDRIGAEDQREVDRYRARYRKPTLVMVTAVGEQRLLGFVLQRWRHAPGPESIKVDFNVHGLAMCIVEGEVKSWTQAAESIRKAQLKMPDNPRLAWAIDRKIAEDLYVGVVELRIPHCSGSSIGAEAELAVQGGGQPDEPVLFPREEMEKIKKRFLGRPPRMRRRYRIPSR